jgi:hypothetical protein
MKYSLEATRAGEIYSTTKALIEIVNSFEALR